AQGAGVRGEMMFGAVVAMCFVVEISILDVDTNGETNTALRFEIVAGGDLFLGAMQAQDSHVASVEHVSAQADLDGAIVTGRREESPRGNGARGEFEEVVQVEWRDKSVGIDPDTGAFGEDMAIDRQRGVQIGAEETVVFGCDRAE